MDIKRIIANNIFILRNYYKLTQQEFADKLNINITRGHISRIENGSHIPSAEFVKAVSDAFGVSADWILANNINSYTDITDIDLSSLDLELLFKLKSLPSEVKENLLTLIESINKIS